LAVWQLSLRDAPGQGTLCAARLSQRPGIAEQGWGRGRGRWGRAPSFAAFGRVLSCPLLRVCSPVCSVLCACLCAVPVATADGSGWLLSWQSACFSTESATRSTPPKGKKNKEKGKREKERARRQEGGTGTGRGGVCCTGGTYTGTHSSLSTGGRGSLSRTCWAFGW
jgi:hypothetical protein